MMRIRSMRLSVYFLYYACVREVRIMIRRLHSHLKPSMLSPTRTSFVGSSSPRQSSLPSSLLRPVSRGFCFWRCKTGPLKTQVNAGCVVWPYFFQAHICQWLGSILTQNSSSTPKWMWCFGGSRCGVDPEKHIKGMGCRHNSAGQYWGTVLNPKTTTKPTNFLGTSISSWIAHLESNDKTSGIESSPTPRVCWWTCREAPGGGDSQQLM